jgi:hypothetical protein
MRIKSHIRNRRTLVPRREMDTTLGSTVRSHSLVSKLGSRARSWKLRALYNTEGYEQRKVIKYWTHHSQLNTSTLLQATKSSIQTCCRPQMPDCTVSKKHPYRLSNLPSGIVFIRQGIRLPRLEQRAFRIIRWRTDTHTLVMRILHQRTMTAVQHVVITQ